MEPGRLLWTASQRLLDPFRTSGKRLIIGCGMGSSKNVDNPVAEWMGQVDLVLKNEGQQVTWKKRLPACYLPRDSPLNEDCSKIRSRKLSSRNLWIVSLPWKAKTKYIQAHDWREIAQRGLPGGYFSLEIAAPEMSQKGYGRKWSDNVTVREIGISCMLFPFARLYSFCPVPPSSHAPGI